MNTSINIALPGVFEIFDARNAFSSRKTWTLKWRFEDQVVGCDSNSQNASEEISEEFGQNFEEDESSEEEDEESEEAYRDYNPSLSGFSFRYSDEVSNFDV